MAAAGIFQPPADTPKSSETVLNVAGFHLYLYGVKELSAEQAKDTTVLFHVHGRTRTHLDAEVIGHEVLAEWRKRGSAKKGLVVATFDNRNHAERAIDTVSIQEWREGNPKHAQDMLSCIDGIVDDLKITIKYLQSYVETSFVASEFIVTGLSLGGHVTWNMLASEPAVSKAIIIVGSPDLTSMLEERLAAYKNVPLAAVQGGGAALAEWPASLKKICADRDASVASIAGKKILILNGAADTLVPSRFTRPWLEKYGSKNQVVFNEEEGFGHGLSADMVRRFADWVIETVV